MTDTSSRNVQPPQQARSAQTLSRVLDACDVLLAKRAFEQISMQDIAREAGVSVGNLYNRFSDRDALVDHIIERHQQEFRQHMESALMTYKPDLSLRERIDIIADTFHAGLENLRPVFATLVSRSLRNNEPSEASREGSDAIIELAVEWLCQSRDEVPAMTPKKARFAVASLAFGLQFDLLLGTATRMFGDDYLGQAKRQAYSYLTHTGA